MNLYNSVLHQIKNCEGSCFISRSKISSPLANKRFRVHGCGTLSRHTDMPLEIKCHSMISAIKTLQILERCLVIIGLLIVGVYKPRSCLLTPLFPPQCVFHNSVKKYFVFTKKLKMVDPRWASIPITLGFWGKSCPSTDSVSIHPLPKGYGKE